MFFTCSAHVPKSAAATKPASRKIIKKAGKKSFAVDLHCHVHVPEADAIAKQTALPPRDPVLQHGSQRSADRQKEQWQQIHHKATSTEIGRAHV